MQTVPVLTLEHIVKDWNKLPLGRSQQVVG